jgi:peptidoglycan lytic transglycosylase D
MKRRWTLILPVLAAACAGAPAGRERAPTPLAQARPDTVAVVPPAESVVPSVPLEPELTTPAPALDADSTEVDVSSLDVLRGAVRLSAVRGAVPGQDLRALFAPAVDLSITDAEMRREAERLFGSQATTFDIDVETFSGRRRVLEYMEFFQTDARDRFAIWLSRLGRYEGMIRERLRVRGLPEDLVYLTLIESGLSNTAVSRARAVGMWQFMSGTGKLYGLTIDPWVDERRDPYRATDAAASLLSDLVNRLGSVYLAAAAYNAGAGRVQRGINRLPGESDTATDETFFLLADRRYLRRETRDYVPKLIAAALIAKQPERYGFTEIKPLAPFVFDEVVVPDMTGLDVIARLADTTVAALVEINPHLIRGVTPPGREMVIRVPQGRGGRVANRYAELPPNQRVTVVVHDVSRGETLSQIARRYRVSVDAIRTANRGVHPSRLRVGQRLVIPLSGRLAVAAAWRAPTEEPTVRATRTRPSSHRVQWGETLSSISRKYGVSLRALLDENDLTLNSVIKGGQLLELPR